MIKPLLFAMFMIACSLFFKMRADAITPENWASKNPGVTLSPDKTAWTIRQNVSDLNPPMPGDIAFGAKVSYWLEKGPEVYVGEYQGDKKVAGKGMHKYVYLRTGEIPVLKWEVNHSYSQCIHTNDYSEIFGERVNPSICGMAYNSGWFAYCADCGEIIND